MIIFCSEYKRATSLSLHILRNCVTFLFFLIFNNNQYTQGLHDKILRSDVKWYFLSHSEKEGFASWYVLDAAKYYAKDHGVEENYHKAYSESMSLITKRPDSGSQLNVSNVNTEKERSIDTKMHEYKVQEYNKQDAGIESSRTPDTSRDMNKNHVSQPNRLSLHLLKGYVLQLPAERERITVLS